jgi:hypothetical protein
MMDMKHCAGCRDDFYNGRQNVGGTTCWSLADAKLIMRKAVHMNQVPPWNQAPQELPSCYRRDSFIYVAPDRVN